MENNRSRESEEKKILIEYVDAREVFNLSLFETYLLLDCRAKLEYESGHIVTGLPVPPSRDDSLPKEDYLAQILSSVAKTHTNERYDPIVLYSDLSTESIEHTEWFADKIAQGLETNIKNQTEKLREALSEDDVQYLLGRIMRTTRRIWILKDGFYDE